MPVQLAALPVEHRPGAGGRDLDVPRREIPMMHGRMDLRPRSWPATAENRSLADAAFSSRIQSGVSDNTTFRFGSTQEASSTGRAASSAVAVNRPGKNPAPARAAAGTRIWRAAGEPRSSSPARRRGNLLPVRSTLWARWLKPAFTTATGRWLASKTSSRNRWPSLAGLPARMPKAGKPGAGSPAREERNRTNGSAGEIARETLSVPSGSDARSRQRKSARATRARPVCAG